jgi:hypothetical protein
LPTDLSFYEAQIPNLQRHSYVVRSDADPAYNCISWAAGDQERPWWPPDELSGPAYWRNGAPPAETIDAFVAAFRTLGYEVCDSLDLEEGVEKIAIYAYDGTCRPSHAARRLPSGRWTSKLNTGIDIEHPDLNAVGGSELFSYGHVARIMCRERTGEPPSPHMPWPQGWPKGRPWPQDPRV